jgi:hypothetical protein
VEVKAEQQSTLESLHGIINNRYKAFLLSLHKANSAADVPGYMGHNVIYHFNQTQKDIRLTIHGLLSVTRELLQLALIDSLQLRASQTTDRTPNSTGERIERSKKNVRLSLR